MHSLDFARSPDPAVVLPSFGTTGKRHARNEEQDQSQRRRTKFAAMGLVHSLDSALLNGVRRHTRDNPSTVLPTNGPTAPVRRIARLMPSQSLEDAKSYTKTDGEA